MNNYERTRKAISHRLRCSAIALISVGVCFGTSLCAQSVVAPASPQQPNIAIHPVATWPSTWENTYGIHPETFAWIMEHNPGLPADFMTSADVETPIFAPNGQRLPLWKMSQFLDHNFILSYRGDGGFTAKQLDELETLTLRIRKMLAHPKTKGWFARRNRMGWHNRMRHSRKSLVVTQGCKTKGLTNGKRIWLGYHNDCFNLSPSIAGTLSHETFYCYGFAHNTGVPYGLGNYTFAKGSVNRDYASYDTVDVNTMQLRQLPTPFVPPMPTSFVFESSLLAGTSPVRQDPAARSVNGVTFEKGVGMGVGELVCTIPAEANRFVGLVGLDDSVKHNGAASVVFELYQANGLPNLNLAKGRPVTASHAHEDGFLPESIVDGDREITRRNYWQAGDGTDAWLEVDLGTVQRIDAVRPWFLMLKDERVERYQISTSTDGNDYRLIANETGNRLASKDRDNLHIAPEIDARFVRITLLKNSANEPASLQELEVLVNDVNVGKGCPVRTSTPDVAEHPSSLTVDGVHSEGLPQQYWTADNGRAGWVEIDLGSTHTIRHLRPTFVIDKKKRIETYTLSASQDGKTYHTIVDMSANTTPATADSQLHTIQPVNARYVRLNRLGNSLDETMALAELEVYESLTDTDQRTLIARSPELSSRSQRWWLIDAPLKADAGKNLFLVMTDAGDGPAHDRGTWCNAGFINP